MRGPGIRVRTFNQRLEGQSDGDSLRVERAKPTTIAQLQKDIWAAGGRCLSARARGWIDEFQQRLTDAAPDDTDVD